MTTIETTDKKKKTSAEPTKGKPKSGGSSPGASDAPAHAGYEAAFRNWELVACEPGPITIDKPAGLVTIFDVRANAPAKIDDLIETTKGGVTSPIRVTQMRFTGESGEYEVSPEPGKKTKLVKGTVYTVIIFGRQRTRAAIANSLKLPATMEHYAHWSAMVRDAYVENESREPMRPWDRAAHVKNLHDAGLTHDQIAAQVKPSVSAGNVSHLLAVFDMPEPVRKMFRDGLVNTTHVRALRPLRKDPDLVVKLAATAVEKEWTEDQLKAHVASVMTPPDGGKEGKSKPRKLARVSFDDMDLKPVPVKLGRLILSNADLYEREAKRKFNLVPDDNVEAKVRAARAAGKAEGLKEGVLLALGGQEVPARLKAEIEESASE